MYAVARIPIITPTDRIGFTLFVAIVAHAALVFGVSFTPWDEAPTRSETLDIILVQHSTDEAPDDADYLAQANQDGGGQTELESRPSAPLPTPLMSSEAAVVAASPTQASRPPVVAENTTTQEQMPRASEPTPRMVLSQDKQASKQKTTKQPEEVPDSVSEADTPIAPEPLLQAAPDQNIDAETLINRSLAMASLSAELEQRLNAYAKLPRRKWITSKTREYKYASYLEAWRAKVERIGNLNYPDEARRRELSGNLLLEVALNADGTVNEINLRRSSGHKVLDDAAIRIVELASPFAPLPRNILEETDILHIERTWRFLSSNQFVSR